MDQWKKYLSDIKPEKVSYKSNVSILKPLSYIIVIVIIISMTFYLFSNIDMGSNIGLPKVSDDFPNIGNGLPWENNNLFSHKQDFDGIGQFGKDYWFEDDKLYTYDGWSFTINKIQDYTLEGIVLDFRVYEKNEFIYSPVNIFSPIDIFVGTEDIVDNPSNYPFTTTSYADRVILYSVNGGSNNRNYFVDHVDNNHIILHNEEALTSLKKISVHYNIKIQGSLVNLRGEKDNQLSKWESDTEYGNQDCQVILVDSISYS